MALRRIKTKCCNSDQISDQKGTAMRADVILPNLGFGMEEGRLIAWLKQPGETVKKGEPIAEIESDKAAVELEALVDGILEEILVPANSVVPVGAILAHIRTGSGKDGPAPVPASTSASASASAAMLALNLPNEPDDYRVTPLAKRVAADQGISLSNIKGTGPGNRITREDVQNASISTIRNVTPVLAAPAVRKLARDRNLDLRMIPGTGANGHVTRADVEAVLTRSSQLAPGPVATHASKEVIAGRHEIVLSTMRQAIGKHLVRSTQEAPHFYVTAELDLTAALNKLPREIGINNLLLYVTVQTLKAFPALNATYENGHLYSYDNVNLAMAVALPNGLISPVLHHADDYSLTGLADRARDLISRARENRLRPEELSGGTFTVSNLGIIQQIERFTAIISPPQVGILAVGAARPRPFVIDGGLHIRTTVHLTLSADHRIVDGLGAAQFLELFDNHLQAFTG